MLPTLCLMSQLPSAMWGIILNMLRRSSSVPCRNLPDQTRITACVSAHVCYLYRL